MEEGASLTPSQPHDVTRVIFPWELWYESTHVQTARLGS